MPWVATDMSLLLYYSQCLVWDTAYIAAFKFKLVMVVIILGLFLTLYHSFHSFLPLSVVDFVLFLICVLNLSLLPQGSLLQDRAHVLSTALAVDGSKHCQVAEQKGTGRIPDREQVYLPVMQHQWKRGNRRDVGQCQKEKFRFWGSFFKPELNLGFPASIQYN